MKFCKDCKHFERGQAGLVYCNHPNANRNLVEGYAFADIERMGGNCGVAGKLFEAKLFEPIPPKPVGFFRRLLSRK